KARRRRRAFPQMRDQQRVTTHFAVVPHAVLRVFGLETGPVAALAEQQQPVVAQAVFLVSARVTREKVLDFLRRSGVQAGLQLPVGGPRLERVTAYLRQQ